MVNVVNPMSAKEAILQHARDLYVEQGLRGMSLRAVAKRAGVSAPAIYKHFSGKEELLLAVAEEGHARFGRYLARGLRGATPYDRLFETGVGYLDFALENRPYYLVMFVAPPEHLGYDELAERNDAEGATTFQMLVDRVSECMKHEVLEAGDPIATSIIVWAHVHGLVTLYYRVPEDGVGAPPPVADEAGFRRLYEASLRALLRGLAPQK